MDPFENLELADEEFAMAVTEERRRNSPRRIHTYLPDAMEAPKDWCPACMSLNCMDPFCTER